MSWLEDMTPGTRLTSTTQQAVAGAMLAYSDHQRQIMIRAGVRLWPDRTLPPEFDALVQAGRISYTTPGAARYFPSLRLVHLYGTVTASNVRHELAHCWDHVRRHSVPSLRRLSGEQLFVAISRTAAMTLSNTTQMRRFLALYRQRIAELVRSRRIRPGCTPQTGQQRGSEWYKLGQWNYPTQDAHEFYAECYRIFHSPGGESGADVDQARLWLYAREMYNLLEHESRSERSSVPDRNAIQRAIARECLPDPAPVR